MGAYKEKRKGAKTSSRENDDVKRSFCEEKGSGSGVGPSEISAVIKVSKHSRLEAVRLFSGIQAMCMVALGLTQCNLYFALKSMQSQRWSLSSLFLSPLLQGRGICHSLRVLFVFGSEYPDLVFSVCVRVCVYVWAGEGERAAGEDALLFTDRLSHA